VGSNAIGLFYECGLARDDQGVENDTEKIMGGFNMNTVEPLLALVQQLDGSQGQIAKKLTMSRATLNRFINSTHQRNPRLDTLVEYSIAAYRNTGKGLAFSWDPVHGLRWSIYNKEGKKHGNN
tara:strand:- start:817 stop:1185 length:369 start_codon:yes stop_codon:yes gene_type:complete